jgi:hypothetical protein
MATTTPNFGWAVPTSTDLVKDGAVAIETLGDSIDASLVDLKGGTTGQVLAKASNTDMDFTWTADAAGIPATIIDAKGDLIAGTAADTAARLAVGTNNYFLAAASAESTGLKWLGASISYTPTWTSTGTTPSIGNGTLTGSYMQVGNLIAFTISLEFGSTTSGGTGNWRFALPFALNFNRQSLICQGKALDLGVRWYTNLIGDSADPNTASTISIINPDSTDGDYLTATYPMTWGTSDALYVQGLYRIGGL